MQLAGVKRWILEGQSDRCRCWLPVELFSEGGIFRHATVIPFKPQYNPTSHVCVWARPSRIQKRRSLRHVGIMFAWKNAQKKKTLSKEKRDIKIEEVIDR